MAFILAFEYPSTARPILFWHGFETAAARRGPATASATSATTAKRRDMRLLLRMRGRGPGERALSPQVHVRSQVKICRSTLSARAGRGQGVLNNPLTMATHS